MKRVAIPRHAPPGRNGRPNDGSGPVARLGSTIRRNIG